MIRTCERLERNHILVIYADTDSLVCFPASSESPPVESLIPVSRRIGHFKVEVPDVSTIVTLAKKFYSFVDSQGKQVIKAKGLTRVGRILESERASGLNLLLSELRDSLIDDHEKTKLYLKQFRFLLNKGGRVGVSVPEPGTDYKIMGMRRLARFVDMGRGVRVGVQKRAVPRIERQCFPPRKRTRRKGTSEDDDNDKTMSPSLTLKSDVFFAPLVLTYPYGYRRPVTPVSHKIERLLDFSCGHGDASLHSTGASFPNMLRVPAHYHGGTKNSLVI